MSGKSHAFSATFPKSIPNRSISPPKLTATAAAPPQITDPNLPKRSPPKSSPHTPSVSAESQSNVPSVSPSSSATNGSPPSDSLPGPSPLRWNGFTKTSAPAGKMTSTIQTTAPSPNTKPKSEPPSKPIFPDSAKHRSETSSIPKHGGNNSKSS